MKGLELPDEVLRAASAGLLPKRLESEERIFLARQEVMAVAARGIVRLKVAVLDPVSPDRDKRIELQGRALLIAHAVVAVGIEGRGHAVRVLAVRGERDHVRRDIQHEAGGGVEELPAEIEDESREDEHAPLLYRIVPRDIGKALIEERGLINDICPDIRIIPQDLLEAE